MRERRMVRGCIRKDNAMVYSPTLRSAPINPVSMMTSIKRSISAGDKGVGGSGCLVSVSQPLKKYYKLMKDNLFRS